jgi:tRNA(Ser,Leu) C12 N-acetylase TAN1
MKILGTFDESIAKVLNEKVKARMSFKVRRSRRKGDRRDVGADVLSRATWIPTASAMKCGRS